MPISLHTALVPSWLQLLDSMSRLVGKAEAHCVGHGIAPEELIQARLIDDMQPFAYQIKSTVVHSLGAIEGVRRGSFSPDQTIPPDSFAALKTRVDDARETLAALDPAELDGFVGRDMRFEFGSGEMLFTAEEFLLSFSQPNFYFHCATAYDILRARGLPIGKRNFTGRVRVKAGA
jgi:hypothetical protein